MHLGANPDAGSSYSENRPAEIWSTFRRIIDICEEEKTELLLIAGDLFHRQPLLRELKEVDYLFSGLTNTQVVLIAGNHDYIKKDSYYRTFSWSPNVHMILERELTAVELPKLQTTVYGLSYYSREIGEPLYEHAVPGAEQRYRILLAHGGDERHIPIQKSALEALGYDYIALGHIHKPQELITGKMAYAGAPEPIDKNDTGAHGFIKGNITKAGCRAVFVPCASREYIHMEVPVEEQTTGFALHTKMNAMIEAKGAANIYKIILTGYRSPEVQFDLANMDVHGNIIEIEDRTRPAYNFAKLLNENKDNLLGRYIESFADCGEESLEYEALCQGVAALVETKRGQA